MQVVNPNLNSRLRSGQSGSRTDVLFEKKREEHTHKKKIRESAANVWRLAGVGKCVSILPCPDWAASDLVHPILSQLTRATSPPMYVSSPQDVVFVPMPNYAPDLDPVPLLIPVAAPPPLMFYPPGTKKK